MSQMEVGKAEGQILEPTRLSVLEAILDSRKVGDRWTCVQPLGPPLALCLVRAASRAPEEASGCELHLHPLVTLRELVAYRRREAWLGPAYLRAPQQGFVHLPPWGFSWVLGALGCGKGA